MPCRRASAGPRRRCAPSPTRWRRPSAIVARAVLDVDEAQHAYAVLEDRAAALVAGGAGEGDPGLLLVRHLQVEQVEAERVARARHRAAAERFHEADRRCAALLRSLSRRRARRLACPTGCSSVPAPPGTTWRRLRPPRPCSPSSGRSSSFADGLAVAADADAAGRLRRGRCRCARTCRPGLSGARGGRGSAAGRRDGGRRAHGDRRGVHGAADRRSSGWPWGSCTRSAARRDALRASFRVPPARGTPSALLGGPAPRSVGGVGARGSSGPRRALSVPARARSGQCRYPTGGGRSARGGASRGSTGPSSTTGGSPRPTGRRRERMYTAGVTLEIAAAGARKTASMEHDGGGNVR